MFNRVFLLCLLEALLLASPNRAQTTDNIKVIRKQMDELQRSLKQIQKEIEGIQSALLVLARQGRSDQKQSIRLNLDGVPFQGEKTAKVTVVEYFDYQCPFCGLFAVRTLPQFESEYVRTGKVKLVMREFPFETNHPQALKAAEAARCADDQASFWPMHSKLMDNPGALDRPSLSRYAKDIGLNLGVFDACIDTDKYTERIRQDVAEGLKAGVSGTPLFLLGLTEGGGTSFKSLQVLEG